MNRIEPVDSETDLNGNPIVGAVLDIIDTERSRYKVAVATAAYIDSYASKKVVEALEKLKGEVETLERYEYESWTPVDAVAVENIDDVIKENTR